MPDWLTTIAWIWLIAAATSAVAVAIDLAAQRRQPMWIMNVVWPITSLWAGPLGLVAYARWGRHPAGDHPFAVSVSKGCMHCGAGCTLGDVIAETLIVIAPFTLFGHEIFGAWLLDYAFALVIGIAFQYFTIVPMRDLSPAEGVREAIKADTLSLSSWQVGMYGWMAIATFVIFDRSIPKSSPVFWFMMQIAMVFGFVTSFPVNWWLLRRGIKERM